jgi:hypothetical protein
MDRTTSDAETFLNDLTEQDVEALIDVMVKVDRLAVRPDGKPVFADEEMDLIGRFQDFEKGNIE